MITLKKLFIKNFKAFQEEQKIPLERITLIFGKNSAGKSTILHAVALLRQILQSGGKLDMDQLIVANKQLNLGSLNEVSFDHDPNNCPTLSVECVVTRPFGSLVPDNVSGSSSIFANDDDEFFDIPKKYGDQPDDDEVDTDEFECAEPDHLDFTSEDGHHYSIESPLIQKSSPYEFATRSSEVGGISLDNKTDQPHGLAKFKTDDTLCIKWEFMQDYHNVHIFLNKKPIASYYKIGLRPKNNHENFDEFPHQVLFLDHPLVQRSRELVYRFVIRHGNVENIERSNEEKIQSRNEFYKVFNDWIENHLENHNYNPYEYMYSGKEKSRVKYDLESLTEMLGQSDLVKIRNTPFGKFCRAAFCGSIISDDFKENAYAGVSKVINELFEELASDCVGWMASNLHFQILTEIDDRLGTDYIPAHRPPPPRDVTKTRMAEWLTQEAGTMSWIQLFDEKVLGRFNAWLDYIGVGITAVCRKLEIHDPDARNNPIGFDPQIVFAKPGRNLRSSHADLGYGVGQLVPIIVAGSSYESPGMKIVEQPEAQVHPGLQARMGDFFIGQSSYWLIETHSEHLILRILRRIRETTEEDFEDWPDSLKKVCPDGICPEDLAVIYVEPGEYGARVIELPIDANGEFICDWPGGFFEERMKELF
jgi:hypothetical protein